MREKQFILVLLVAGLLLVPSVFALSVDDVLNNFFNRLIKAIGSITGYVTTTCTNHAQCSQACTSLCPPNVYGCCYGCLLGQCVNGVCQCTNQVSYCSSNPTYQVGSKCTINTTTTTTTVPNTTCIKKGSICSITVLGREYLQGKCCPGTTCRSSGSGLISYKVCK